MKNWTGFFTVVTLTGVLAIAGCGVTQSKSDVSEKGTVAVEEKESTYTIEYYADMESTSASTETTIAVAGEKTQLKTVNELGFSKENHEFLGWRINREEDNKWYLRDSEKNSGWFALENGELPAGYHFVLKGNGGTIVNPETEGVVRLYAYWGPKYTIEYYPDIDSEEPASITTEGVRQKWTQLETLEALKFNNTDKTFIGWRIQRTVDDKWYLQDEDGNSDWYSLEDGELPDGYTFDYRNDGSKLWAPTTSGTVKLYAEWE